MSERICAYCGIEEDAREDLIINKCPVCEAFHCPICGAMIEFAEQCGRNDEGEELVNVYRSPICKVHLPWNILEGIKRGTKENE